MSGRKAVITGIGCITALGVGLEALWAGVRRGKSPLRVLDRFDAGPFRSRVAAQVEDFVPEAHLDRRQVQRLDRYSQFAVVAGQMALEDAGLRKDTWDPDRVGVMMGSALGGAAFAESQHARYLESGLRGVSPMLALSVFCGAASCNLAIELGIHGPNQTNAMSCSAGAVALGTALRAIQRGDADVMLAGGCEAPLSPLSYGAFAHIRAMSCRNDAPTRACRPFDQNRDGFVMGEGAAVLVLEEEGRARARGARIYAELAGFGTTLDAFHMTAPRPDGREAARAMRLALQEAGLGQEDVDYVNAHGSSTVLNDTTEALAIERVFEGVPVPVSGTKPLHGHALGASPAMEAAIVCKALVEGHLPGSVNLESVDPEVRLNLVPKGGVERPLRAALSNSFGFGGINACLAFVRV